MDTPPQHDACRWHSRAGDTLFGSTPTLYDPRATGITDTSLINAHEQTHVDLINNTLYGYVLSRLRDLSVVSEPLKIRSDRLIHTLPANIWMCAEGAATATEANIVKSPRAATTPEALLASLTPDYREALGYFQCVVDYAIPFPPPVDLMARAIMIHAVAECAADLAVFMEPKPPVEFWKLAEFFDEGPVPDEELTKFAQGAASLPIAPIAYLFDTNKQLMSANFGQFVRNVTTGLKLELLVRHGVTSPTPMLDDNFRVGFQALIDAELQQAVPALPKMQWRTGYVTVDTKVELQTQEPPFLLEDEELEPTAVLPRMFDLAQKPGFQHFVILFLRELPASTYSLIVHPMALTAAGLDMATPYLISKHVPQPLLKIMDGSPLPLVWQARILPAGQSSLWYDRDLISLLARDVYLELKPFSWENAGKVAESVPGQRRPVSYQLPPEMGMTVSAIHAGRITVFGFTPLRFLPGFDSGQQAEELPLGTNVGMASVSIVLLRQSTAQTI
jgi:hypothetical protein